MSQDRQRPLFEPGEVVRMVETSWPIGSKNKQKLTGLYEKPGHPVLDPDIARALGEELTYRRKLEHCVGQATAGDTCLVVACTFFELDQKWYYLLNNGKPLGFGWTRCGFRMRRFE